MYKDGKENIYVNGVDWVQTAPTASSCEHGTASSGSVKGGACLDWRKRSAPGFYVYEMEKKD
jgi:hypothetical protein